MNVINVNIEFYYKYFWNTSLFDMTDLDIHMCSIVGVFPKQTKEQKEEE